MTEKDLYSISDLERYILEYKIDNEKDYCEECDEYMIFSPSGYCYNHAYIDFEHDLKAKFYMNKGEW
jgi:hypothetical protein